MYCGALTRKKQPCRMLSEPGRRRCKFHGGRSTGPRTPEGRARIAEAQFRRWSNWRTRRQTASNIASEGDGSACNVMSKHDVWPESEVR
nr:HGGxSTG domain-containing protein [Rubellimicrobium roseum]